MQFQASHQPCLSQTQINLSEFREVEDLSATWATQEMENHIKVMRSRRDVDNGIFGSHQSKYLVSPPQGHNQFHKLTLAFDSPLLHEQTGSSDHQEAPTLVCLRLALTLPRLSLSRPPTTPVYLVPCPRPH